MISKAKDFLRQKIPNQIRTFRKFFPGHYYFFGEFGFECLFGLPYAHYLSVNNQLRHTKGVRGSSPFYFFSPKHIELPINRSDRESYPLLPINRPHTRQLNQNLWCPPPYKEYYKNDVFRYKKPTLVVANKYNSEWDGPPVNYLDLDMLRYIFETLSRHYQIIYNRYTTADDNSRVYELGDFELIRREFPDVLTIQDLVNRHPYDWNTTQLMVYSNCDRFISVQGGASVLASYFGGINLIYAVRGFELVSNEINNIYPLLSGCKPVIVPSGPSDLQKPHNSPKPPFLKQPISDAFRTLIKQYL